MNDITAQRRLAMAEDWLYSRFQAVFRFDRLVVHSPSKVFVPGLGIDGVAMEILYIRHKLGRISAFLPDERLIYSLDRLRAVSLSCAPLSRGFWSAPFFRTQLRVTNRRVFLSCGVLPCYRQEVDLWFPGRQPEGKKELIQSVSVGEGRFGPCLEIRSRDETRRQSWFSSPELTTRVFCDEPEQIERAIRDVMAENQ